MGEGELGTKRLTDRANNGAEEGVYGPRQPTAAARRGEQAVPRRGAAAGSGEVKSGGSGGRKDRGRTALVEDDLIGFRFGFEGLDSDSDSIRVGWRVWEQLPIQHQPWQRKYSITKLYIK